MNLYGGVFVKNYGGNEIRLKLVIGVIWKQFLVRKMWEEKEMSGEGGRWVGKKVCK